MPVVLLVAKTSDIILEFIQVESMTLFDLKILELGMTMHDQ